MADFTPQNFVPHGMLHIAHVPLQLFSTMIGLPSRSVYATCFDPSLLPLVS